MIARPDPNAACSWGCLPGGYVPDRIDAGETKKDTGRTLFRHERREGRTGLSRMEMERD